MATTRTVEGADSRQRRNPYDQGKTNHSSTHSTKRKVDMCDGVTPIKGGGGGSRTASKPCKQLVKDNLGYQIEFVSEPYQRVRPLITETSSVISEKVRDLVTEPQGGFHIQTCSCMVPPKDGGQRQCSDQPQSPESIPQHFNTLNDLLIT